VVVGVVGWEEDGEGERLEEEVVVLHQARPVAAGQELAVAVDAGQVASPAGVAEDGVRRGRVLRVEDAGRDSEERADRGKPPLRCMLRRAVEVEAVGQGAGGHWDRH
jgi:hypothetical protein